jgi:hypothetical protein
MSLGRTQRVAVIGARGIGKHHAHWWSREGAKVCAILGTSQNSLTQTIDGLRDSFGIDPNGFTSFDEMVRTERPDIIDVCSPAPFHFEHVEAALAAGCDVLCEKPFVYDPEKRAGTLLDRARGLAARADTNGRRLGICTQYSVAMPFLRRAAGKEDAAVGTFVGHLESPAKGRAPDPRRVWVDLSPHVISVALELMPGAYPDWNSLEVDFTGYRAETRLDLRDSAGKRLACTFRCANATEEPLNTRRFILDDEQVDVGGAKDAEGVYCAKFTGPAGEFHEPDMMRLLIRDYLAGLIRTPALSGIVNLEIMLGVLSKAPQPATG